MLLKNHRWRRATGAGGIGGILSCATGTTNHWFHYDGNGNVVRVTDSEGAIVSRMEYGPFGTALLADGDFTPRFQFSSKEYDTATGLNYYGYRFYSPELGRWINREPLGDEGFLRFHVPRSAFASDKEYRDQSRKHPYAFVDNSPIFVVDIHGLIGLGEIGCGLAEGPIDAALAASIAAYAVAIAKQEYGNDPGKENAYRHCLWGCTMTSVLGRPTAEAIEDCHEKHGRGSADKCDSAIDKHNNKVANDLGENKSGSCRSASDEAMKDGSLITNQNDSRVKDDCKKCR